MHTGNEPTPNTNRMSTYQLASFFSRMADELECPFFLAFARRQKCKCQMAPKYKECQMGLFGSDNQPVATDNTTGNEAGRQGSFLHGVDHLSSPKEGGKGGSEGEGGRGDRSNGSRKDEKLVLPTKRAHRLRPSAPCTGVSGCLTDCDGDVNAMVVRPRPSTLRLSERTAGDNVPAEFTQR